MREFLFSRISWSSGDFYLLPRTLSTQGLKLERIEIPNWERPYRQQYTHVRSKLARKHLLVTLFLWEDISDLNTTFMDFHLKIYLIFFVSKSPGPALNHPTLTRMIHLHLDPRRTLLASPRCSASLFYQALACIIAAIHFSARILFMPLLDGMVFLFPDWEAGESSKAVAPISCMITW